MRHTRATVGLLLGAATISACTALPPPSMPEPKAVSRQAGTVSFMGSREEAARLAVATLRAFGLSVDTVDAEAGFVGGSSGLSTRGLGERVGIYFREKGDGSLHMWVVALRKSRTNPRPPDYQRPVRVELERRIAALRDERRETGARATDTAAGRAPESRPPEEVAFEGEFTGACFVAGPDGEILTTHRAVAGATALRVHLADGRVLAARLLKAAPALDLALLRAAASTPAYLAPATGENGLRTGLRIFGVRPSARWPQGGPRSADADEGVVQRTSSPTGEQSLFETTIASDASRYGTALIDRRARALGVVTPVPASVRVLQARGELDPEHCWAVNLRYASALLPAVHAEPTSTVDQAVSRAQSALCRVEARFR